MTLPTSSSWVPKGARLGVPAEAPQGRRVNASGAPCTHGPAAGRFEDRTWASLPKRRAHQPRTSPDQRAAAPGLVRDAVGPIDAERCLAFVWQTAGRADAAPATWKRTRPLMIVLDTYAVHKSQTVANAHPPLEAADVYLIHLPAYGPELSAIEPDWNEVKQPHMPMRSFEQVAALKRAVDGALAHKAYHLRQAYAESTNFDHSST